MIRAARYAPGLRRTLSAAGRAYRRRADDLVRRRLERALELAPQRLDIRLALANHHILIGGPERGLEMLRELSRLAPGDADILFLLSYWAGFAGLAGEAKSAAEELAGRRPEKAADLAGILAILGAWEGKSGMGEAPGPSPDGVSAALVVFGYRLEADGSPHPRLIARLEKTLEAAGRFPESPIVVSGGMPRAGQVEAAVMRRWLTGRGIGEERILEEGYARDLVENILYSRQLLAPLGVGEVICLVSADSARRAGAGLEIAGWNAGTPWRRVAVMVPGETSAGAADSVGGRLKLFRDALRVYGLPLMRIYPELVEL
ncbi:MAG: YdcF family protein [Planctomycetota bacterium]|jgi:hypothetical protein|nr:YdcF family protein [Planctomycetota bacterium]